MKVLNRKIILRPDAQDEESMVMWITGSTTTTISYNKLSVAYLALWVFVLFLHSVMSAVLMILLSMGLFWRLSLRPFVRSFPGHREVT
jgi:hypothetical protein